MGSDIAAEPLSPCTGVQITGIDPRQALSKEVVETLQDLIDRYHLLAFRGHEMTVEEQVKFTENFGEVADETGLGMDRLKRYCYVSNVRRDGATHPEAPLLWHSDNMWSPAPTPYIFLYGSEVEGELPPTRFANTIRACQALPEDLRREVEGLRTINMSSMAPDGGKDALRVDREMPSSRRKIKAVPEDEYYNPRSSYPIVWQHPRTGEEMLTVQEDISVQIEGKTIEESEEIYQKLFDVLYDEDYVYDHHWQQNDLVMFDNIATQHARQGFFGKPGIRTLRRTVINPRQKQYFEHAPRVRELAELHLSVRQA